MCHTPAETRKSRKSTPCKIPACKERQDVSYPGGNPEKSEINSLHNPRLQGVARCVIPRRKVGKSEIACIPICMTFTNWLLKKEIPDSDRIAMLIQSAGAAGIPETQLRSKIELPKELVDELLMALVDARIVRVAERQGIRRYFGW